MISKFQKTELCVVRRWDEKFLLFEEVFAQSQPADLTFLPPLLKTDE